MLYFSHRINFPPYLRLPERDTSAPYTVILPPPLSSPSPLSPLLRLPSSYYSSLTHCLHHFSSVPNIIPFLALSLSLPIFTSFSPFIVLPSSLLLSRLPFLPSFLPCYSCSTHLSSFPSFPSHPTGVTESLSHLHYYLLGVWGGGGVRQLEI